jgi:hypothetical protein
MKILFNLSRAVQNLGGNLGKKLSSSTNRSHSIFDTIKEHQPKCINFNKYKQGIESQRKIISEIRKLSPDIVKFDRYDKFGNHVC